MTSQSFDAARDAVTRIVRDHWKLFLIEGIILVILGLLAVAVPVVAGLAVTILFGWLFLISGIVGLITTFAMRLAGILVVAAIRRAWRRGWRMATGSA